MLSRSSKSRVFLAPVGGEEDNKLMDTNLGIAGDTLDARLKKRVRLTAGPHAVAVAFLRKSSTESDEPLEPFTRDLDLQNMNGIPLIDYVDISGPYQPSGSGDTPSRRRIFSCRPAAASEELPCARRILTTLARRAYRRPVTDKDLELLVSFYQAGRNRGTFDSGVESALRLILIRSFYSAMRPIRPTLRPARFTPSAISNSPRDCRFSCGAAFTTTCF
jgi:hypothetical protein